MVVVVNSSSSSSSSILRVGNRTLVSGFVSMLACMHVCVWGGSAVVAVFCAVVMVVAVAFLAVLAVVVVLAIIGVVSIVAALPKSLSPQLLSEFAYGFGEAKNYAAFFVLRSACLPCIRLPYHDRSRGVIRPTGVVACIPVLLRILVSAHACW